MANTTFPIIPGNLPVLARALNCGRLTYDIDWTGLPEHPHKRRERSAFLLQQLQPAIEKEFRDAALCWTSAMPVACALQRVYDRMEANIVLRFVWLTEAMDYTRMATTGTRGAPVSIWLDTASTPWGLLPVNHFLASLLGWYRVPLFNMLLHEIGHALGAGHSDDPQSVMYAPPHAAARPPDLHTRTLARWALPPADRARFREVCMAAGAAAA